MVYYIICFVAGVVIGAVAGVLIYKRKKKMKQSATFVMDFSDPAKDICRLEIEEDLNLIYEKDYILVKIERKESQE